MLGNKNEMDRNNNYLINGKVELEKISTNIDNRIQKVPALPTFDVNMRVENHTRNAILALARVNADQKTANEMAAILIANFLDKMTPQDLKAYQDFFNVLEQKDELECKLKNK